MGGETIDRNNWSKISLSGAAVGFGLGGFFDGIVLHQILQWHHLLSGLENPKLSLPNQIVADGLFHLLMYIITVTGLVILWRNQKEKEQLGIQPNLVRAVLLGFGLWHLVDAVFSHWILGLHRIRPEADSPLLWDILWLFLFGFGPIVLGLAQKRHIKKNSFTRLILILGTTVLGTINFIPLRDNRGVVTAAFLNGDAVAVMSSVSQLNGRIIWHDASTKIWTLELPKGTSPFELYRHGAQLVSHTVLPVGCFSWKNSS